MIFLVSPMPSRPGSLAATHICSLIRRALPSSHALIQPMWEVKADQVK